MTDPCPLVTAAAAEMGRKETRGPETARGGPIPIVQSIQKKTLFFFFKLVCKELLGIKEAPCHSISFNITTFKDIISMRNLFYYLQVIVFFFLHWFFFL